MGTEEKVVMDEGDGTRRSSKGQRNLSAASSFC